MTDKMREAFERNHGAALEEILYNEETDRYEANDESDGYALDYAVAMNNEWRVHKNAWQAAQSVPVVGEVWRWAINKADGAPLLFVCSQADADKYRSRSDLEVFPVYRQPTHSVTAAELERLRKDAERYRWIRSSSVGPATVWHVCMEHLEGGLQTLKSDHCLDEAIDAAIAAEG